MNAVYLETSAVVRWLFQETAELLCSALTLVEVQRVVVRAERERPSRARQLHLLRRQFGEASAEWHLMEITPDIRIRAGEPFPNEPVRTLDAIHLATALDFARVFPALPVLTFDEPILRNLEPLGLTNATT